MINVLFSWQWAFNLPLSRDRDPLSLGRNSFAHANCCFRVPTPAHPLSHTAPDIGNYAYSFFMYRDGGISLWSVVDMLSRSGLCKLALCSCTSSPITACHSQDLQCEISHNSKGVMNICESFGGVRSSLMLGADCNEKAYLPKIAYIWSGWNLSNDRLWLAACKSLNNEVPSRGKRVISPVSGFVREGRRSLVTEIWNLLKSSDRMIADLRNKRHSQYLHGQLTRVPNGWGV